MRRHSVLLLFLLCNGVYCAEPVNPELDEQARQLAQRFVGELKPHF